MSILVYVDESIAPTLVMETLASAFPEVSWDFAESPLWADLVIRPRGAETVRGSKSSIFLSIDPDRLGDLPQLINSRMMDGELILPTNLGSEILLRRVHDEIARFRKLEENNPLYLKDDRIIAEDEVDGKASIAIRVHHHTAFKRYCPDLKEILFSRVVRNLQRKVEGWRPCTPLVDDPGIVNLYPKVPLNAMELRERLESIGDELRELDLTISSSVMDYSQLSLGTFFAGGLNREIQGLTSPSETFDRIARIIANTMLLGAARSYLSHGAEAFSDINVRVGVKSHNYQGALLNTYSHTVRQTLWSIMQKNGDDIFHFSQLNAPIVSGYRSQDNGSGKRRACFVPLGSGVIARAKVVDGEQLKGQLMTHFRSTSDPSDTDTFVDEGWAGARKRVVANVWSGQNDALLPIPAYIAHFKDLHYKYLFQQDELILSRFVSNSYEFERFWTEGYLSQAWVREAAAARGCPDLNSFIAKINELGEVVAAGDVVNFDGNASWELASVFLKHLVSDEAFQLTQKLWRADKIGVYVDHTGQEVYYYISSTAKEGMSPEEIALVEETAKIMSALISGLALTAQVGRGLVPTALLELTFLEFKSDIPGLLELAELLPSDESSTFSFLTAFMNSAGDDHILGTLVLWLLTGTDQGVILERLQKAFQDYKTLLIQPEFPKMNAGWLFHDDDKGRCVALSRSVSRMFANLIYPEYPRSAVGILNSAKTYIESSIGSPDEEKTMKLAELIITRVYNFESMDHLQIVADAELDFLSTNTDLASPVQQISAILGVPQNDLEWKFSLDELIELGIDPELLDLYRKPIPESLTKNPTKFLNLQTVERLAAVIANQPQS